NAGSAHRRRTRVTLHRRAHRHRETRVRSNLGEGDHTAEEGGHIMTVGSLSLGRLGCAPSECIRLIAFLAALAASLVLGERAAAVEREVLTIHSTKPLGPVPGQFSTAGAFSDSGTFF